MRKFHKISVNVSFVKNSSKFRSDSQTTIYIKVDYLKRPSFKDSNNLKIYLSILGVNFAKDVNFVPETIIEIMRMDMRII